MELVNYLIEKRWLKTPLIIEAFRKIERKDFMPEEIKYLAEIDEPMPIGYGQTISQPAVVAFMLEELEPKPGEKILDIGSGSGWTTALLSYIVSKKKGGKVIALEIIPELKEFGEKNTAKYNFIKKGIAKFFLLNGQNGCPREAPFDKILSSAAVEKKVPESWKKQLKEKGKIVAPVGEAIVSIKREGNNFQEKVFPGFLFVPLVSDNEQK